MFDLFWIFFDSFWCMYVDFWPRSNFDCLLENKFLAKFSTPSSLRSEPRVFFFEGFGYGVLGVIDRLKIMSFRVIPRSAEKERSYCLAAKASTLREPKCFWGSRKLSRREKMHCSDAKRRCKTPTCSFQSHSLVKDQYFLQTFKRMSFWLGRW